MERNQIIAIMPKDGVRLKMLSLSVSDLEELIDNMSLCVCGISQEIREPFVQAISVLVEVKRAGEQKGEAF